MKTLKLRIKDKHAKVLKQMASEVSFVWNYVNDLCFRHLQRTGQFLPAYDVAQYTKGASKECHLHSQTPSGNRRTHQSQKAIQKIEDSLDT